MTSFRSALLCRAFHLGGVLVAVIGLQAIVAQAQQPAATPAAAVPAVRFFNDEQVAIGSAAVRASRGHLVHSGSVYPARTSGDFARDFESALDEMPKYLATTSYEGELRTTMVKLHVCVSPGKGSLEAIDAVIKKRWPDGGAPAVTVVGTSAGDDVAIDAVFHVAPVEAAAATEGWVNAFDERFPPSYGVASPARDLLHVSGRAAGGELGEAAESTMAQLFDVLKGLGSGPENVVQVKAFIQPIDDIDTAEQSIAASFEEFDLPPIVFVQWTSTSRATEIEMIAMAPGREEVADSTSYYTPPGDKASPVFSRVGRIHGDQVIFIGGIAGTTNDTGEGEVLTLFDGLKRISAASGSDLRHFAKATYYVSGNEVSTALNALRPHFYDPLRPPAASKVMVPNVAIDDRSLLIDMIAAPLPVKGQ